jgi:hypothetical protein
VNIHGRKGAAVALVSLVAAIGAFGSTSANAAVRPVRALGPSAGAPTAGTPTAHLSYHGGPLINNVAVTPVVWGSWNYGAATHTSGITTTRLTTALNTIVNSRYIDWLSEYNAGGGHIGRGTVDAWRTVNPGAANDGNSVDDTQIAAVLRSEIARGALPAASNNRLYTFFFRKGQMITLGGANSYFNFCGYHSNTTVNGQNVWYAVLPFEADNGGCQKAAYTHADNLQAVLSHEVIEAVTDPAAATTNAWYDDRSGYEIGDVCAWRFGTINDVVVQKEWSNQANACIVHK